MAKKKTSEAAETKSTPKAEAPARVAVGIDLGTSNSAIALAADLDATPDPIAIPQLVGPDTVGKSALLASAVYLPHDGEVVAKDSLPWSDSLTLPGVVGAWARERGAQVPDRLVSSAKSWLCNPLVDRRASILPWRAEIDAKLSPVAASRIILAHLKAALEHEAGLRGLRPERDLARIVLTVPASFDEVARALTHEAAESAGLGRVTLLEEPQAALYAWIAQSGGEWRKEVKPGEIVLVVDVGGGTTDFSLIAVSSQEGDLRLERISVGEHLLLGGDNMDLALAHSLRAELEAAETRLDAWQFMALVHSTRMAKERLFTDSDLDSLPISIPSRGSSLFAKAVSTRLERARAQAILDGFLPMSGATDMPAQRRSIGIQEYGLPFVADPAISRHLARFLTRSLENVRSDSNLSALVPAPALEGTTFLKPTAILFNGGVFNAPSLRERVRELVSGWCGTEVRELSGAQYDLAVAKGAAYYARTLVDEKGIRIKAGTARSYYLGLEPSMPAIPGFEPPVKGLCVVPQGIEEGSELHLENREFGLVTGEPVEFRFFSSAVRAGDGVGAVVDDATHELEETSRLQVTLPPVEGQPGEIVPVKLDALVTEVGTLELYLKHTQSDRKWNLEFNVRPGN